ncbi:MAG: helix-turn-helix domain-containing protein [Alphaproteobacteria bacterium]
MEEVKIERLLVSVEEAGIALSVGRSTVWKLINSGNLQTRKIGRRRLVTVESVQSVAKRGAA